MRGYAACLGLLAAVALALGACSADKPPEENPNIPPTNYKQEIMDSLTHTLGDPTNLRDTYISDPALVSTGLNQRYAACVRFNTRDADHRYMGVTDQIAYFYGGHLNQLVDATPEQCGNAAYKPFPELAKLCRANKCN